MSIFNPRRAPKLCARRSIPVVLVGLVGSLISGAVGAAQPALSLSTLLAQAEAANLSLHAARDRRRAAQARIEPAAALDDPVFSYALAPNSLGAAELDPGHIIGVAQPLPWPGKLKQRRLVAAARADQATARLGRTRDDLRRTVRRAYADWVYYTAALRLNRQQRARLSERENTARGRYRSGAGAQSLQLVAALALRQREVEAATLRAGEKATVAQINALRDQAADAPLGAPALPLPLPAPPALAVLREAALEHSPRLRELEAQRAAAEAESTLARLHNAPDLRLTAQYLGTLPRKENRGQIGLSLNLPFGRDKHRGHHAAAAAEAEAAGVELAARRRQLEAELAAALANDQAATATLELYSRELLPLARQLLAARDASYAAGAGSADDLIAAEEQRLALALSQARARRDAAWARADLAWLSGGHLDAQLYGSPAATNTNSEKER